MTARLSTVYTVQKALQGCFKAILENVGTKIQEIEEDCKKEGTNK